MQFEEVFVVQKVFVVGYSKIAGLSAGETVKASTPGALTDKSETIVERDDSDYT